MRHSRTRFLAGLILVAACERTSTPEPPENLVPGARVVPVQRSPIESLPRPDTIANPKDTARIRALMVSYFDAKRFVSEAELPAILDGCAEDASEQDPGHLLALADARVLELQPTVGDSVSVPVEVTTVADLDERDGTHMRGNVRVETDTMKWTIRPAKHPWRGKIWEVCDPGYGGGRDISNAFFFIHQASAQHFDDEGLKWSKPGTTWESVRALADSVAKARSP